MQDDQDQSVEQVEATDTDCPEKSPKAKPGAKAPQSAGEGGDASSEEGSDDPQLLENGVSSDPCPGQAEPAPAPGTILDLKFQREKSEALKAIVTERIYLADPATAAERKAAEEAYRAAAARPDGPLWKKYMRADWTFNEVGEELKESVNGKTRLQDWIDKYLAPGRNKLIEIFQERKRVEAAIIAGMGPRECRFRRAEERLKAWEKASQDWKAPVSKIEATIDSYAPLLEKLPRLVHEGDAYAIYRYWFEVAPKHLRLRDSQVLNSNAYGICAMSRALQDFPDRRRWLESGKVLDDGSLFLLDPGAAGTWPLEGQRKHVLDKREAAATDYAMRKALFQAEPDTPTPLAKQLADVTAREAKAPELFPA